MLEVDDTNATSDHHACQNKCIHQRNQIELKCKLAQLKKRYHLAFGILASIILMLMFMYAIRQLFPSQNDAQLGKTVRSNILSLQVDPFWKLSNQQLLAQQQESNSIKQNQLKKGQHIMSRQQLGRNTWALLHMISGNFPDQLTQQQKMKFNMFLILFGQFYPCKLCSNHFMQMIKQRGLFRGNTKKQLMQYLCYLHNIVNKRLNKQQHSCQNIVQEWSICGCSSEL